MSNLKFMIFCLISTMLVIHCARKSEPLNPGEKIAQESLLFLTTGSRTGRNNIDDSPRIMSTIEESPGVFVTQVRSTSYELWTDLNLSTQQLRSQNGPFDIGFQRYKVRSNSGITNPSGLGGVCRSNTTAFPATAVSASSIGCTNFEIDVAGQAEVVGGGGASFNGSVVMTDISNGWFTYNLPSLNPNLRVFVLRSGQGNQFYAIQVIDYYSNAGTSGYPKFRWRQINAP